MEADKIDEYIRLMRNESLVKKFPDVYEEVFTRIKEDLSLVESMYWVYFHTVGEEDLRSRGDWPPTVQDVINYVEIGQSHPIFDKAN